MAVLHMCIISNGLIWSHFKSALHTSPTAYLNHNLAAPPDPYLPIYLVATVTGFEVHTCRFHLSLPSKLDGKC